MIIHCDITEPSRLFKLNFPKALPLPWSTYLCNSYYPHADWESLLQDISRAIQSNEKSFLIFHLTDLEELLESEYSDLITKYLDQQNDSPQRYLLIYSGRHQNWGDCREIPLSLKPLPAQSWQITWALYPYEYLKSPARPLAWLHRAASRGESLLRELARPSKKWLTEQGERWTGFPAPDFGFQFTERDFWKFFRSTVQHELLEECLDKSRSRPRPANVRRRDFLNLADRLWLLDSITAQWPEPQKALREILSELERFLGPCTQKADLRPEARDSWEPIIEKIENIYQKYSKN